MFVSLTMAEAKRYFEMGMLKGYTLQEMLGLGVEVQFEVETREQRLHGVLADARTKKARAFKSWDGAVSALRQVGFQVQLVSGRK